MLGQIFTHETKPLEVEILVAAVGFEREGDRMFHIRYDGSVTDEDGFAVLGGEADSIRERLAASTTATTSTPAGPCRPRSPPWPATSGPWPPTISRSASWPASTRAGASSAWRTARSPQLLGS